MLRQARQSEGQEIMENLISFLSTRVQPFRACVHFSESSLPSLAVLIVAGVTSSAATNHTRSQEIVEMAICQQLWRVLEFAVHRGAAMKREEGPAVREVAGWVCAALFNLLLG